MARHKPVSSYLDSADINICERILVVIIAWIPVKPVVRGILVAHDTGPLMHRTPDILQAQHHRSIMWTITIAGGVITSRDLNCDYGASGGSKSSPLGVRNVNR